MSKFFVQFNWLIILFLMCDYCWILFTDIAYGLLTHFLIQKMKEERSTFFISTFFCWKTLSSILFNHDSIQTYTIALPLLLRSDEMPSF